jgi:hypothetical protein
VPFSGGLGVKNVLAFIFDIFTALLPLREGKKRILIFVRTNRRRRVVTVVELAIKKSGTTAEKLLYMVKAYEYRYRAQDIR